MNRSSHRNLAALAVGGLLVMTACSDSTGPGIGEASVILTGDASASVVGEGISLSLGDVPETAVGNLYLTITRIDLHLVGGDDDGAEGEGAEGEAAGSEGAGSEGSASQGGWISLDPALTEPLDILTLSTAGVQIADGMVTAGTYNQVRFFFDTSELVLTEAIDVNGVTIDPGTYDVTVPSAAQSGLKLNLSNVEVADGETETVAIEIGMGATIGNLIWNANGFQLSPVLRTN